MPVNEFPYTNLHELNIDWILKIVKDFQEKYGNFDETYQEMLHNIEVAGTEAVEAISADKDTALAAINAFLEQCVSALDTATTGHVSELQNVTNNQITAINGAGQNQRDLLAHDGDEYVDQMEALLAQVPSDYRDALNQLQIINSILNENYTYQQIVQGAYPQDSPPTYISAMNTAICTQATAGCAGRTLEININSGTGVIRQIVYWTGWASPWGGHWESVGTSESPLTHLTYTFPIDATYFSVTFTHDWGINDNISPSDITVDLIWHTPLTDRIGSSVSELKSALNNTTSGINDMMLKTSSLVLNVPNWSESYTTTTPNYRISQIAVVEVSPNVAYHFVWQAITTWRNESAIRFTLMNNDTAITNYLFSADDRECEILTSATTNRIKVEAVITTNSSPISDGVYQVYNLIGYVGDLTLNDKIDVQTVEEVSAKIQGTLIGLLDTDKILYENALIVTPYTKQTGTYKSVQIARLTAKPNTTYTWIRGFTYGGVVDRDINIALYAANDTKIIDIPLSDSIASGIFSTNANTAYIIVSHILSLGSTPANNGYVVSGNVIICEELVAFSAIMDVAKQSAFAPVVKEVDNLREDVNDVMVMPSYGESLDYKRLDQIIISTTYRNLYPAGSQGISETYAFDVTGVTTPVTIVVKDNNTIALAYSDVPMASINSGDSVTPLYAYTLINGEITVPAHVFNGHSTLLVSSTYKAAKRSLCKCVKGTTDSYKRRPPIISFIDDDGGSEALDNWEELGNSLGIRCGFAIITGSIGSGAFADWEKIKRLASEGYVFISHTHGHRDITTLTDEEINADALASREAMISHGLSAKYVAYPGGIIDKAHYAIIQRNYEAGIAGGGALYNKMPLNPINIVRSSLVAGTKTITVEGTQYTVNAPKTIENIKAEFDALIMNRGWLIFTSHFRNSLTDGYYYNSEFSNLVEEIVKYAAENGVMIKTFFDAFPIFNNRLSVGYPDDSAYYIVDCDGNVHEKT